MTNWNMRTEELKLKDGGAIKNYHYEFNSTDRVAAKIVEDVFKAIMDISANRKTEPQTEDGEDYLRGYQDGYNARGVLARAGVEIHIDKPRGYTLNTDTNDAWKPKTEPQTKKEEIEIALEMALNNCKTKHKGCRNCDIKCAWRDEPYTERRERCR